MARTPDTTEIVDRILARARIADYRAPVNELSGVRTYPSEKPSKKPDKKHGKATDKKHRDEGVHS